MGRGKKLIMVRIEVWLNSSLLLWQIYSFSPLGYPATYDYDIVIMSCSKLIPSIRSFNTSKFLEAFYSTSINTNS